MIQRYLIVGTSGTSLATTYQTLDGQDVLGIEVALLLLCEELLDFLILIRDDTILGIGENLVEAIDEVHESCYLLISHGDIARCLVGDMQVVLLLYQTTDGTTHGDDIIIWVWREDDDTLGIWLGTLWAISIVGIRLATRPSRNGMLQVVEYLDVGIVGRAIESQKFTQSILVVILVGQLQDRLVYLLAEPYQGRAHQLVGPPAGSNKPWMLDASEMGSSTQVEYHVSIRMRLEERSRQGIGDTILHYLLHNLRLLLAPGSQVDSLG